MPVLCNPAAKGGTGKSLLMQALAEALAGKGRKVLVVDNDPQANISRRLRAEWDPLNPTHTLAEALRIDHGPVQPGAAAPAVRACGWDSAVYPFADRIDVLPSRFDLQRREYEAGQLGAVDRMKIALRGVEGQYDWTLIDCAPNLGHLSQNAMAASDFAVFSANAEYDAIEAAVTARDFMLASAEALHNSRLQVLGVVTNAYRRATSLHPARFEKLQNHFQPEQVWVPRIPQASAIADALDRAEPVLPQSRVARPLFMQLADRLEQEAARVRAA